MGYNEEDIQKLWKKAKKGKYFDNDELKNNNGYTNGLNKYDFKGNLLSE